MKLDKNFTVISMLTRGGAVNPYKISVCSRINVIKDYKITSFNASVL